MKIGVVGLGLIGGSIFKRLTQNGAHEVVGVSRSVKLDNVSSDYAILKTCNLIFVCTPMNSVLQVLDKLEEILSENTIVTDVCSLKEFVTRKQYKYKFIPSHPMAGTEFNGWESSFAELFNGANWVITPNESTKEKDINILKSVIIELGANVVYAKAEEHDRAVAMISHMPMVIAQALCENIKDNELAQILASSGFRDTTRLALSNTEMANDMINLNKKNIIESANKMKECFDKIIESDYLKAASDIKHFREKLY